MTTLHQGVFGVWLLNLLSHRRLKGLVAPNCVLPNSWISDLKTCYILMSSLAGYVFLNNLILILFLSNLLLAKNGTGSVDSLKRTS